MSQYPQLERVVTDRMILSRPTAADRADFLRTLEDPRVMATLGGVRVGPAAEEWWKRMIGHWDAFGFGLWMARDKSTNEYLGRGGTRLVVLDGQPDVEASWTIVAEHWGKGLATEMARRAVRAGFETIRLPSIVTFTLPTNLASQNVMKKVGFRYERDGIWADRPHVFYRLNAEDWKQKQLRINTDQHG